MKSIACLGLLALSGAWVADASAAVYYYDDFENQPVTDPTPPGDPLQPPPIGIEYRYAATTQIDAVNVVTSPKPTLGTKSLETVRTATQNSHVVAVSTAGAMVDGKVLEIKWSHQLAGGAGHRFNAPMQNSFGYSNGGVGRLAFITIADTAGHGGEYHYSDAFDGDFQPTGLIPTVGGWDHLRMVVTLDAYDAQYMTGTYDLYISINGAPEVLAADDAVLNYGLIATEEDAENELTSAWFRLQKGPSTANSYHDNISIADLGTQIPEPVSAVMASSLFGLLAFGRRRR